MRVLYVSDVYFPRVNGVSTSIATFRADLAQLGVATTLVAPSYGEGRGDRAGDATGEGVIRVPSGGLPGDPEDRRMRWGALQAVLAAIEPGEYGLVHVQTPFLAHYAGVRHARRLGIPVVETYHTFFEEYLHHYVPLLPRPAGRWLARHFTRSQCAAVDALIAPSAPMQAVLADYGVQVPMHVIPTGMPADRFVPGDASRFRARHGLPPGRPLLLHVGRVAHEKNIGFLLEMLVQLRHLRPDALLVIAGEGPARAPLMDQARRLGLANDVAFIGYLDRERGLADCYAAADVFVFASRTETQGLVLLEAMAQGRPVVSTSYLGTASILVTGCGAHVAPEETTAFAEAVHGVLEDPARAARMGEQARRHAEAWSSRACAARMVECYAQVLARQSRAADRRTPVAGVAPSG
jgi:1,2-diacylglycerol 3-alpha-glucosyltransferase